MSTQVRLGTEMQLRGRVKEAVGIVTADPKLEREGERLRREGAVRESVGKARRKVGELVEEVADKIKK